MGWLFDPDHQDVGYDPDAPAPAVYCDRCCDVEVAHEGECCADCEAES